jgi:group I intron endonuclease
MRNSVARLITENRVPWLDRYAITKSKEVTSRGNRVKIPNVTMSGVYSIYNRITRKRYVGSTSRNLMERAKAHRDCLNGNRHPNIHLQRSWNKYGEDAFTFFVLKMCPPEDCIRLEQRWIDVFDTYKNGYNRCPTAGSRRGTKHSDVTKEKIAATKRGKKASPETKAKMSAIRKGRPRSAHHNEVMKIVHWSKGPKAKEIAEKIGNAQIGKVIPYDTRAKIRATKLAASKIYS